MQNVSHFKHVDLHFEDGRGAFVNEFDFTVLFSLCVHQPRSGLCS